MKPTINNVLSFMDIICIRFFLINILLILFLIQTLHPQIDSLIIEHIEDEQGLSNFGISSIIQDGEGYMWFATPHGVERYDGYGFQSYSINPNDTIGSIHATPTSTYVDKEGTLWFCTFHGVERFNRSTNSFTNYLPDKSGKGMVLKNIVFNIIEDNNGTFWAAAGNGLYKFNKFSGEFSKVQYAVNTPQNVDYFFSRLYLDKEGSLWYGIGKGLDKLNYKTGKLVHVWNDPENKKRDQNSVSKYIILSFCEDNSGNLWLGTRSGLVEFNKKLNTFTNYIPDPGVHNPWNVNHITSVCFDPSGFIWVGTSKGIFTFDTKVKKFIPIKRSANSHYLGNDLIGGLYIDQSGTLWASIQRHGIYKIIQSKPQYKKYFPFSVGYIVKGRDGILWVKKSMQGWIKFDTKTDQILPGNLPSDIIGTDSAGNKYFLSDGANIISKGANGKIYKYDLLKNPKESYYDMNKGLWYGSYDGGLYFFDFNTHKAKEIYHTDTYITTLYKDLAGMVWAATVGNKLICYDPDNKSVSEFTSDPKNPSSISGEQIFTIYQDKKGRLWFATDAGLDRFVPATRTFIHFTDKDGLSGNIVYNIIEDDHGNIWIGTNKGISKFNPEKSKFKNYGALQGVSSIQGGNLAVKMDNGEIFFGRSYGLIGFYPDSIKENTNVPPIAITSFSLFDKPVPFGKEIKLTYDKNFLSFEFAALNYYNSQRNQYAYKMEGIDKEWIYSGTRRYASYPNISPGKYIFRVKGSNNDGIWNETGTSISIIISPPWWKTTWAYFIYGFVFVFTLYALRRYELNGVKLKDKIKMDAVVLKEREEIDKVKSRFFANISHEFRTPLTLIMGPIEKIISISSDEKIMKEAGIAKRNSRRLLQLVNQLLDLSKLEAGKLKLEAAKSNIVSFVKGIALSFESLSEEKDITLKIISEKDLIEAYFDKEKMVKILSNILSNAFKFTGQNGKITISIHTRPFSPPNLSSDKSNEGFVEIKIKDTGIGIPQEEIPKLFDRFYQVDSSFSKEFQGTGIGLALTKELVELHHGKIIVQSEKGSPGKNGTSWTEFTLYIPLGRKHLKDEEIVEEKLSKTEDLIIEQDDYFPGIIKNDNSSEIELNPLKDEKTIILIVEDNYDMREYIKESLGEGYLVEEAINGEQGVRKAESIIPDLIISDMMMPKMDGNELTRTLKNNEKTSHIPIIILTAKSGQENKLEGLETGADDYLTKPFDIRELQIRIKNLINIRKKLQQKFRSSEYININIEKDSQTDRIKNPKLIGIDEKFINKVLGIIEKHISEEYFSVEELGNEIGMSKAQLFRKIKALTGMPVGIYLRSVRLAKAKKMIEEKQGNISEIAFSVGFSSPSYFSKCFKDEFGYTPSNFIS